MEGTETCLLEVLAGGKGYGWPCLETGNCYFRVVRGGAYTSASTSLRTRKRDRSRKDQGYPNIGFRVVREP